MNILFLIFHGLNPANGISKKIIYQTDALKANGHQVDLCSYTVDKDGFRKRMINDKILENYGKGKSAQIKKRICYQTIVKYAISKKIEIVYIRHDHNANPFTIHFVKMLKKNGIKTLLEIPTYPYDEEFKNTYWKWQVDLFIDKCFRRKLATYFDKIVTFSNVPKIFGAPTICISNGIDFEQIKLKQNTVVTPSAIHLLGVAEVHSWHGYDRLIEGLGIYYQQLHPEEVYFHIAGRIDFNEDTLFKNIIEKYQIQKYVIFHGPQHGTELDKLFDTCQIGIGSLARHRTKITYIKTLKNREYAARGIPFIYSETDDDFEHMPYILKVPADESPIEITSVLKFFHNNRYTPSEIRTSISHLSWKEQMKKVIENI